MLSSAFHLSNPYLHAKKYFAAPARIIVIFLYLENYVLYA